MSTLCGEMVGVYRENYTKHANTRGKIDIGLEKVDI
jgi:hypothetical protein